MNAAVFSLISLHCRAPHFSKEVRKEHSELNKVAACLDKLKATITSRLTEN